MIRRILSWYRARQRELDRTLLLPSVMSQAADREQAISALMVHASMDPAWCGEMTPDEAQAIFEGWVTATAQPRSGS